MSFPHFWWVHFFSEGWQNEIWKYLVALKFEVLWQKVFFPRHWEAILEQSLIWKYAFCLHVFTRCCPATILGDPGAVSRVGRKDGTKVFTCPYSRGERAPGYRLSPNYFQTFKLMPAPDWAQKMICIIVPNQRTVSPEFFSWVRTWLLLPRSRLVWIMHQRDARSQETFSLMSNPHLISKYCLPEN